MKDSMQANRNPTIGKRYVLLDVIGEGGMGTVFRALDRLTRSIVAVKSLMVAPSSPDTLAGSDADLRVALTQEFQILASLRHPHIVSVLDYGFDDQRRPFFTMPYLAQAHPIHDYARNRTEPAITALFWQALQALRYLHHRGVLHRDVKPDNLLVLPDGTLTLLDFGLASLRRLSGDAGPVGSLPYLPPEVLRGGVHSASSDMYSLALVWYEMLSGAYPYPTDDLDELIAAITEQPVDLEKLDIPLPLKTLLARLLAKNPADRFVDVDALLAAATELDAAGPPVETALVRDSHLQAARFVGRAQELAMLRSALRDAGTGRGSAFLIGGESGVGKSRLLDELRVHALVEGVQVLRVQAAPERSASYDAWRDALRTLLLDTQIDDLTAEVLSTVVPDIAQLLGRAVATPPVIAPRAARERLFAMIVALVRRQQRPTLLLIEDLQWLDDSLNIVAQLSHGAAEQPLLIVGTFRLDELPQLPAMLPQMRFLPLPRFSTDETGDLIESALGQQHGLNNDLISYVYQQTEGNVFFIVETLRALAEEAGQLRAIGDIPMPLELRAAGVRDVVQRRLAHVIPSDLPLLQAAALVGRELDLTLLGVLAPHMNLSAWIARCASMFEAQERGWRFAHDKLREGTIATIALEEQPHLHAQIAAALAQVYTNDTAALVRQAYHWGAAGTTERELQASAEAGAQLLRQGAYDQSLPLLERAHALATAFERPASWRATLARDLADAMVAAGRAGPSFAYLHEALHHLHAPMPDDLAALDDVLDSATRCEIVDIQLVLAYNYLELSTNGDAGVAFARLATALQAPLGPSLQQADCAALLAVALQVAGELPQAADYAAQAGAILHAIDDAAVAELTTPARALSNLAAYWTFAAGWQLAAHYGERAVALAARAGDRMRARVALMNLAAAQEWQGAYAHGLTIRHREYETALQSGDVYGQMRALAGVGQLQAYLGQLDDARRSLERRAELLDLINNSSSTRYTYLGMIYWRLGWAAEARAALVHAINEVRQIELPTGHDMFALQNTAETLLGLWEATPNQPPLAEDDIIPIQNLVTRYANHFLSGEAQFLVLLGRLAWLRGNEAAGGQLWHRALALALERGNRIAAALAHFELGRHAPGHTPARALHLAQAQRGFAETGAGWNLAQLLALATD